MRVNRKIHRTRQPQRQLDHIQNRLILVQPHVMIRNRHRLERHRFRILKKRIRSPHVLQPINLQQTILLRHILGQPQPMILPRLGEKYVRRIGHRGFVNRVQSHHSDVEEHDGRCSVLFRRSHFVVLRAILGQ